MVYTEVPPFYNEEFYSNFSPDDYDYVIVGLDEGYVKELAQKLEVMDSKVVSIGKDLYMGVTYHS